MCPRLSFHSSSKTSFTKQCEMQTRYDKPSFGIFSCSTSRKVDLVILSMTVHSFIRAPFRKISYFFEFLVVIEVTSPESLEEKETCYRNNKKKKALLKMKRSPHTHRRNFQRVENDFRFLVFFFFFGSRQLLKSLSSFL